MGLRYHSFQALSPILTGGGRTSPSMSTKTPMKDSSPVQSRHHHTPRVENGSCPIGWTTAVFFCDSFRRGKCCRICWPCPCPPATRFSTQRPNIPLDKPTSNQSRSATTKLTDRPIKNQTAGGGVHSSPRRPRARGCSPTRPSTSATSSPPCWPRTCCTLDTCRCSRSASRPLRDASASTPACGSRGRYTRPSRWTRL